MPVQPGTVRAARVQRRKSLLAVVAGVPGTGEVVWLVVVALRGTLASWVGSPSVTMMAEFCWQDQQTD